MIRHPTPDGALNTGLGRRQPGLLAAILLAHLLVLLGWRSALMPRLAPQASVADQPALVWLDLSPTTTPPITPPITPPVSPVTPGEAAVTRPTRFGPAPRSAAVPSPAPAAAPRSLPAPPPATESTLVILPTPAANPAATALAPEPAASSASAPRERLLDSAASREALRHIARQPLLSERAAGATGQDFHTGAQRMADAASAAGKGDCLKGGFAGAGAGLLSLPFLAVAAATGQCAK